MNLEPRHDFVAKLRQESLLPQVQKYIEWQRAVRRAQAHGEEPPGLPDWVPFSINLDLTTACNYRCDHCIDWDILNSGVKYNHEVLKTSLRTMQERGLRSVILIGGGEPTVYPGFEDMVYFLKSLGLQVAVVSNGSRNERILRVMDSLGERDWIRLSLDSGSNETFRAMHKPVKAISLDEICSFVPAMRARNPLPGVGFSFIIVWEGAERSGDVHIVPNIDEIVLATKRARDAKFNYISLKPFLTRHPEGAEVMDVAGSSDLDRTIARIRSAVDEAKKLETPDFRVVESTNLKVLESGTWREYTKQPRMCHKQAFQQVLSPLGLYNCPAYRGVAKARIAGKDAYSGADAVERTSRATGAILEHFDASQMCAEVTCLYNPLNWWLEHTIAGEHNVAKLEALPDGPDFFL